MKSGLDGFSDHNVLEFLLFYAIPKKDTNVTAHNLIDEFGSLKGVLDAPVEMLSQVKGIGEYTATYLSMISQVTKRYFFEQIESAFMCNDTKAVAEYARTCFVGESNENVLIIMFGADGRFINSVKIKGGEVSSVNIDKRALLQAIIRNNAAFAVMAHNHPGGVAAPSASDVTATKDASILLSEIGVRLYDHIIIAGNDYFSLKRNAKFASLFL